jgi:hypothetical protein
MKTRSDAIKRSPTVTDASKQPCNVFTALSHALEGLAKGMPQLTGPAVKDSVPDHYIHSGEGPQPARVPVSLGSQGNEGRQGENTASTASAASSIADTATFDGHRRMRGGEDSTVSTSTRFASEDYTSLGQSSGNELSIASGEMIGSPCDQVSNTTSAGFTIFVVAPVQSALEGNSWLPCDLQLGHELEFNTSILPYMTSRGTESNIPRGSHNVSQEVRITDRQRPLDQHLDKDCFVAISTRLAQLEESLAEALPPVIEVIFKAEGDTRNLQAGLFSCRGHQGTLGQQNINCLDSFRPVLHILTLLAERVLKDLFCRPATLGKHLREARQVCTSTVSRRLERSVRSLLDCT